MNLKSFIIFLLCFIIIFSYSKVKANEEVKYEIVKKNEIYEIRKYADRLAVQTININQNITDLSLQLLAINIFKKESNYEITLLFSDNGIITLSAEIIEVTLEDQK